MRAAADTAATQQPLRSELERAKAREAEAQAQLQEALSREEELHMRLEARPFPSPASRASPPAAAAAASPVAAASPATAASPVSPGAAEGRAAMSTVALRAVEEARELRAQLASAEGERDELKLAMSRADAAALQAATVVEHAQAEAAQAKAAAAAEAAEAKAEAEAARAEATTAKAEAEAARQEVAAAKASPRKEPSTRVAALAQAWPPIAPSYQEAEETNAATEALAVSEARVLALEAENQNLLASLREAQAASVLAAGTKPLSPPSLGSSAGSCSSAAVAVAQPVQPVPAPPTPAPVVQATPEERRRGEGMIAMRNQYEAATAKVKELEAEVMRTPTTLAAPPPTPPRGPAIVRPCPTTCLPLTHTCACVRVPKQIRRMQLEKRAATSPRSLDAGTLRRDGALRRARELYGERSVRAAVASLRLRAFYAMRDHALDGRRRKLAAAAATGAAATGAGALVLQLPATSQQQQQQPPPAPLQPAPVPHTRSAAALARPAGITPLEEHRGGWAGGAGCRRGR